MEQLRTNHPNTAAPTIRVKLQTGANSVEVQSAGIESTQACSTIEYLTQSSFKTAQELQKIQSKNSALFIVCVTLILASLSFAIAVSATRYASAIIQNSPRYHEQQ